MIDKPYRRSLRIARIDADLAWRVIETRDQRGRLMPSWDREERPTIAPAHWPDPPEGDAYPGETRFHRFLDRHPSADRAFLGLGFLGAAIGGAMLAAWWQ